MFKRHLEDYCCVVRDAKVLRVELPSRNVLNGGRTAFYLTTRTTKRNQRTKAERLY